MKAIDTNILVRLVARDDPKQMRMASRVMAGDVLVLPTVLLEAEWVLRSRYKMPRSAVAKGLSTVLGQSGVTTVSAAAADVALAAYAQGGDFADLLHAGLAAEHGAEAIVTFDRRFASVADLPVEVAGQDSGPA